MCLFDIDKLLSSCLNDDEDKAAESEGWQLVECEESVQLQKIDEKAIFESDAHAHKHVKKQAELGSPLHLKVKTFLKSYSPDEYDTVFNSNNNNTGE